MSDVGEATILVGGRGRFGFAVSTEDVGAVVAARDLPERYRSVSLPRLFDDEAGSADEDRYAEVRGTPEPTFVELGPDVRVRPVAPQEIQPIPALLARNASRWGWRGIVLAKDALRVLVDVAALAPLAAPRRRGPEAPAAAAGANP